VLDRQTTPWLAIPCIGGSRGRDAASRRVRLGHGAPGHP